MAERILGGGPVWAQEVPWQREYRYQAFRADATPLDLTLDEGRALPWQGVADGFVPLVDRRGVADRLRADLAGWTPPEHDAEGLHGATLVWLHHLAGRLRRGQLWMVRCGLTSLADQRIVSLLGSSDSAERRRRLDAFLPASGDAGELRRALLATAELYDEALTSWAERTGSPRPSNPLAATVLDRIRRL